MPDPEPASVPCPVCGAPAVDAGRTVHGSDPRVAGVPIDLAGQAARLRRCPTCRLLFKHPFVDDDRLLACYRDATGDHWEHDPDPRKRRFDQLVATVERHAPPGPVLDVGCSNGALLTHLPETRGRFGLEPGEDAARVAAERGVGMLGATLDDLEPDARFAAILAIDVLEHLTDPGGFLDGVARHLQPGGVFVGLTGDHAAWGWRLQGAAYWYAALPEHQVFYTRATIDRLAADRGLEVAAFTRTSHARHSVTRVIRDAIRGTVFGLVRRARIAGDRPGPGWLPARDHLLAVLRRPDAS